MEGIAAGSKVRTRQSHEGKSCAICAAADCNCLRIQPGLLDGFLGVIDQVHARLDLLFHVAVLFFDDEGYGTFAVFLVEKLDDMSHQLLAAGEHGAVVVTDNVVKACRRHISAHFTEMEKSLILFCVRWGISCRKHVIELHGNQGCIDHGVLTAARVYRKAFDLYFRTCGIEVLILDLILRTAIYSIGKICSKVFYIEEVCAAAHFFIRGKADTDFSMRNVLCDHLLCHSHDLSHTSLVICTKKGASVGGDQGSSF